MHAEKKRTAAAFIYFSPVSESLLLWHSKYAWGERGNCHRHTEVGIWRESGPAFKWILMSKPSGTNITPPSFSAVWSGLTLGLCECHNVLAVKPFLKQTVT